MKTICAYLGLLLFSVRGFAEVPAGGFFQLDTPANFSPNAVIEQGNLKDANGFLFNPVCTGALQSPALITDLSAFFEGYAGTRVIDRGDRHYLLVQKTGLSEEENLSAMRSNANAVYAELEFSSAAGGTFALRAAPAFFTDTGMDTSSCLAGTTYRLNEVTSENLNPGNLRIHQ